MSRKRIFTSFAFALTVISTGLAQYSARESFDYANGTSLDTLVGTSTDGWGSSWDAFDLQTGVFTVETEGLTYGDLAFPVQNIGKHVGGANPTAWGGQRLGRYLDKQWPNQAGQVYWLSFIYELSTDFTANGWAGVSFFDSTSELTGIGHGWGSDSIGIWIGNVEGKSAFTAADGIQWLVAKIVMKGDSMSRAFLWVSPNPAGAEPDTTSAHARGDWNWHLHTGFNRVVVHFGGEGVGMTMGVDEIRLGTTWGSVSSPLTSVELQENKIPIRFTLSQNFPNPFNPETIITYSLPEASTVTIKVYDMMGREVSALINGERKEPGNHHVTFGAADLPSGVYFYKLQAESFTAARKMLLLK